jgi:hypothetical protein
MSYCVFQYETEVDIDDVRKSIVDMVLQCLETDKPITKPEFYVRIPRLLYGRYPLRAGNNVKASLDALLWKYSELTGKYCGCQYWSDGARCLFVSKILECTDGRTPTSDDTRKVTYALQKKTQADNQRIVHEHVFPRAELRKLLLAGGVPLSSGCLLDTLERLAIGCVILRSEDRFLKNDDRDYDNPWLRYKGRVRLFDNPKWNAEQRKLIREAGLL